MKRCILVTGAAGFLGGRTAKFLAEYFGEYQIVATSRRDTRALEFINHNCHFVPGDLCNFEFCESVLKHTEIVIHCAALSAPFGPYESFYQSNYIATKTLLEASIKNNVKRFIFISTPSIYFNYSDRFNVRESDLLPEKMVNHYAQTKLLAENIVLQNNGKVIDTMALRPRAIIGAEDTVIFPRMLEAYHKGKLKIVGDGKNICDFTCVRNVMEAIVCGIKAPQSAFGEAYNITDGEAVHFWEALNFALKSLDLKPPTQRIPKQLALLVAGFMEYKAHIMNETKEPPLTKYSVGILANHFTMDISKARTNLNYKPVMKTFEGIQEYILWHKTQQ
ncbi:MAG: NAD-dependent epimerase/dehydratase family protein [Saprospiraceae bacterium]|jgi:nucleoside-diphosphate-sugar epimerase|nr:NAD-dependent epimerase/dehydratase family protein [Saprospiraceae bacterium]